MVAANAAKTAKKSVPRRSTGSITRYFTPLAGKPIASSIVGEQVVSKDLEQPTPRGLGDSSEPTLTGNPTSISTSDSMPQNVEDAPEEQRKTDRNAAEAAPPLISEYERKRLARVAQNAQFLRELGMATARQSVRTTVAPKTTSKVRARDASVVTRRSSRLRGPTAQDGSSVVVEADQSDDNVTQDEPASYQDSSVYRYTCGDTHADAAVHMVGQPGGLLVGFQESSASWSDPSLRKIYTISFSPFDENGLTAAGGHQGHVSIYPRRANSLEEESSSPLMSFRAHRGWISCLSLARSVSRGKNLLISAANDGIVKLWDLNQSVDGVPKELLASQMLHRSGIFGMDIRADHVLTCSKDSTIALARFDETGAKLRMVRRYEDHDGVVKTCRFNSLNQNVFASGGNDRHIRVYDMRDDQSAPRSVIHDAHARAINSIVWHPTNEHLLLSASFDAEMHLYDLRQSSKPFQVIHTAPSGAGGSRAIFHPCFVAHGEFIVSTGGSAQDQLTLQRTADGKTVSCGQLPLKSSYVSVDPYSDRLLVAMGQRIQFYSFKRLEGVDAQDG